MASSTARPSELVAQHRDELRRLAARHGLSNLRVFGSVARGDDGPRSDVDILAHLDETYRAKPLRAFGFGVRAEELLGVPVDLVLDDSVGAAMPAILAEAAPL